MEIEVTKADWFVNLVLTHIPYRFRATYDTVTPTVFKS